MKKIQSWLDPVQTYSGEDYLIRVGYHATAEVDAETYEKLKDNELFKQHVAENHITITPIIQD